MSHLLTPSDNASFLKPEEIAKRFQEAFPHCEIDREGGADAVGETIVALLRMNAPAELIEQQRALQEESIAVVLADDPSSEHDLNLVLKPGEGILVPYYSAQHQEAVRRLVERCAEVLGYEIGWP
ncbi:hypothetical protein [Bremerella cremea]|uniref:hypothetical protein n=1 Tax=Bremerella cremea TaxID=1031537 RepID=UPI0031F1A4B3